MRKKCPTPFGQDCTWCTLLNWKLSLPHLAQGALQSHDLVADLIEMNLTNVTEKCTIITIKELQMKEKYLIPFCPKFKGQNLSGGSCLFNVKLVIRIWLCIYHLRELSLAVAWGCNNYYSYELHTSKNQSIVVYVWSLFFMGWGSAAKLKKKNYFFLPSAYIQCTKN